MHTTSSQHQSIFSFDFVFAVRDDLALFLCPSPPGVRSGRAALHGFATRLVVYTLNENVSISKQGSGQSLVRVFGSSVNLVNVVLVEPISENFWCFVETIGTDIAVVVVAVGEECNLMYVSEADVTKAAT